MLAPPGSELSHGGRACCPDPDSHPDYELRQAGPHFTAWGLRPVRALGPPAGRSWWGRPRSPGPALSAGVLNPHVGVPVSVCLRVSARAGPPRTRRPAAVSLGSPRALAVQCWGRSADSPK